MMQIDLSKLIFHSAFSGFGNYTTASGALAYAGGTVTGNANIAGAINISNAKSVSQTEIQLTGMDSKWYKFKGALQLNYNDSNVWQNNIANATKQISIYSSYTPTQLVFNVWLSNISFNPSVMFPAITFNLNASLFLAPF